MDSNLILAGVGGQGTLTIARAITIAATRRGMHVRQAEVHGMSQRGGAVQSHLRISDGEIYSDLVPLGRADILIAVEPLESLRYLEYLQRDGTLLVSTDPVLNLPNYPPLEELLERISRQPRHVLLDADRLARLAGSQRAANTVMLGAASLSLPLPPDALEAALGEIFAGKGAGVVETACRAFRIGRNAAMIYGLGLERGGKSRVVRQWLADLPGARMTSDNALVGLPPLIGAEEPGLSPAEHDAVSQILKCAAEAGREALFEHEVYGLVELVGAIHAPRYLFIPHGGDVSADELRAFGGDRVVLKLVSADVTHKSDAGAVRFVPNEPEAVRRELNDLFATHERHAHVEGALLVEYVPREAPGFGDELFVGIRATREFGPVIAAGLGGVDTEFLARSMLPGVAVAKAVVADTNPSQFLELFRRTAAYETLSGKARGHRRLVSDGELLRCFRAFLSIAREFCAPAQDGEPRLIELEVNPFSFRAQRLIPLDGRGRLGAVAEARPQRPAEHVRCLLDPKSIAVLGVSANSMNFGRIILNNAVRSGFPRERLIVVREGVKEIDGVRCVRGLRELGAGADLLVVAVDSKQLPTLVDELVETNAARSVILIPGGVGETQGSNELNDRVRQAIARARENPAGPVFLGPNSMGLQSRPGRYDTFFVPADKFDSRWSAPARRAALISQSGAFMLTRMSHLESLDPALAISLGNQFDLTLADLLNAVADRHDVDAIGVYAEGFQDLDGLAFLQATRRAIRAGKRVIFYKAGRTAPGRSAAAGHTASVAGDYDVCQAAAEEAGALVIDTFSEFQQLMDLATSLHAKEVRGRRVGVISNAGYEAVGMADAIRGARYEVEVAGLADDEVEKLRAVLSKSGVERLVNARNPLDLTPMSNDEVYESCTRVMLDSDEVDAVVVGIVPMTPALRTLPDELHRPDSVAQRLIRINKQSHKPLIAVVDTGRAYDPLVEVLRSGGIPVFHTSDHAIRSLGRYLCHRAPAPASPAEAAPMPAVRELKVATAGA